MWNRWKKRLCYVFVFTSVFTSITWILCLLAGMIQDIDMAIIAFLVCAIISILVSIYMVVKEEKAEKAGKADNEVMKLQNEVNQFADYTRVRGEAVLSIKKRSSKFSQVIKIRDDHDVIIDYDPVRYIYTSATVGGITTGGVEKVGGHTYVAGKLENGKCVLEYFGEQIEKIQLTDELYQEAKESEISKYLNDKKQIVVDSGANPALLGASARLSMDSPVNSLTLQMLAKSGYPTQKKCIEILNWLCRD